MPFKEASACSRDTPSSRRPTIQTFVADRSSFAGLDLAGRRKDGVEFPVERWVRSNVGTTRAQSADYLDEFEEQVATQSFMRFLSESRVTSLLTVELPDEGEEPPESFLARGEVRLHRIRQETGIKRYVSIEKYKGSSHEELVYPYEIGDRGVVVHALRDKPAA